MDNWKCIIQEKQLSQRLLRSFSSCYNIQLVEDDQTPITARCDFFEHSGQYVISKKAELWSADNEEFLYVVKYSASDTGALRAVERSCAGGRPWNASMWDQDIWLLILHRSSSAIPVMKTARKALKKCRIYKSFHFSLHGWMDHHTALVELSTGQIDAKPWAAAIQRKF